MNTVYMYTCTVDNCLCDAGLRESAHAHRIGLAVTRRVDGGFKRAQRTRVCQTMCPLESSKVQL